MIEIKHTLKCDKAMNGQEAVDKVLQRYQDNLISPCVCNKENLNYKVIFMDCNMPVLDGFQATEVIRKQKILPQSKILIYAVTAYTGDSL